MINFFRHISDIFEGYYCLIARKMRRLNKQQAILYDYRYLICSKCKHRNKVLDTCNICGCWLPAKTSVNYDIDKNGKSELGCPEKNW